MNAAARQSWLVARRELRERSRSAAFRASVLLMVLGVAAAILLPNLISSGGGTKDVGLAGSAPAGLSQAIQDQGNAVGTKTRIRSYDTVAAGEAAVRSGKVDVLVVDANRLEWRRRADEKLKTVVTGAIQLVALQQRAAAAGISPQALGGLLTPVTVTNVELGQVAGRGPDDETAALVMTLLLFWAVTVYGAMVMGGVVEEKSSRVVEVLLARMPARNLLAGKIVGIGLLGLAQMAVTALVAIVAVTTVGSFDVPAVRGAVIAWAVVWFLLGYALYATVFGALGSLASRTEDTQSVAGPVSTILILGYFVSFATIGSPDAVWARIVSFVPAFSPFALPNRIAMGGASWWEPVAAAGVTIAAIAGLVVLGGRIYTAAILHSGPTLKLREAWQASTGRSTSAEVIGAAPAPEPSGPAVRPAARMDVRRGAAALAVGFAAGGAVIAATRDVIIGVAVGAVAFTLATRIAKAHPHVPR